MHVMKSVASRADAEKLAKNIVENDESTGRDPDDTGKQTAGEDQTEDTGAGDPHK